MHTACANIWARKKERLRTTQCAMEWEMIGVTPKDRKTTAWNNRTTVPEQTRVNYNPVDIKRKKWTSVDDVTWRT